MFFLTLDIRLKAQSFIVSEPIESYKEGVKVIGKLADQIIVYKENFQKRSLQFFNSSLVPVKEIELEFTKNQVEILNFVLLNDHLNILYAYHQKGNTVFRNRIIDNTLSEISDSLVVISDEFLSLNQIKFSSSENRKKIIVHSAIQGIQFFWFAFDLSEQKLLMQQNKKNYESYFKEYFSSIIINNSGDIFFTLENNNSIFRKNYHQLEIYSSKENNFTLFSKINLNGLVVSDFRLQYDEQNKKLNYIGLYGDNFNKSKGLFNAPILKNDTTILLKFTFEDSLVKNMTGQKRKKYNGIPNLAIKDIIFRKDGGYIFVAEQFLKYEHRMASSPYNDIAYIRNISFLFENVMILSLNPDGKLLWREILHKSQKSENDDGMYSSFFLMKNSGVLRFLYNDQIGWSSSIYEFILNGRGISKRNKIYDNNVESSKDLLPEFKNSVQINSNEVVTIQKRNSKFKLIKIQFD